MYFSSPYPSTLLPLPHNYLFSSCCHDLGLSTSPRVISVFYVFYLGLAFVYKYNGRTFGSLHLCLLRVLSGYFYYLQCYVELKVCLITIAYFHSA